MIIQLLLLGISLLLVFLYSKYTSSQNLIVGFSGPPGLPLVGNALDFVHGNLSARIVPYFAELVEKYGPRVKFFLGWMPFVIISSSEDIEKILSSTVHIEKGDAYKLIQEWLGEGIVSVSPEKWHSRRKLLNQAFHYKILDNFLPIIDGQARQLVSILKSKVGYGAVQIETNLKLVTLDVLCETAMGRKVNAQLQSGSAYSQAVKEAAHLVSNRIFTPWLIPDIFWKNSNSGKMFSRHLKTMKGLTNQVLFEKMEARKGIRRTINVNDIGMRPKEALLDLLLGIHEDSPEFMTSQDILDDVETFLFAGHDTSSTLLQWTLLVVGNHPEIQGKIQEELDTIFGDNKSRAITNDDVRKMEYLELVLKESLRMYSPVPLIQRHITSTLVLENGAILQPGVNVWIPIHHIHNNPKYWKSPEIFNPERFTVENSRGRHPYTYIPFSAGPRNCIGFKFAMIEAKVILASLLREFKIKSAFTMEEITPIFELIYKPSQGVHVELFSRN